MAGSPVTNQVSQRIIQQANQEAAIRAQQQQQASSTSSTTNTTSGGSGLSPTAEKIGAVIYYDPNPAMRELRDAAIASGIPNVPALFLNTQSFTNSADAQKIIEAYYNSISLNYNVNAQLQTLYNAAIAQGISNVPNPPVYQGVFTDQNIAQRAITNYENSIPPTYNVTAAMQSAYTQATAAGIPNVPAVPTVTKVYTNQADANAAVKAYTDTIPQVYNVNAALQQVYASAQAEGISNIPPVPTTTTVFIDQSKAQAVIDTYVNTINSSVTAGTSKTSTVTPTTTGTTTSVTTYNVVAAMQSVFDNLKSQGYANIPAVPKDTNIYTTQATAQAPIQKYVDSINSTSLQTAFQVSQNAVLSGDTATVLATIKNYGGSVPRKLIYASVIDA
jgi:hypothetical protein